MLFEFISTYKPCFGKTAINEIKIKQRKINVNGWFILARLRLNFCDIIFDREIDIQKTAGVKWCSHFGR